MSVVFTSGCFDLIHVGHIRLLNAAVSLGTTLIVGINSDESVRKIKGEGRPLIPEKERKEILKSIKGVDAVIIFNEETADDILKEIRPNIFAKGTDYTIDTLPEKETCFKIGCRIAIVGDEKKHSTKEYIEKMKGLLR